MPPINSINGDLVFPPLVGTGFVVEPVALTGVLSLPLLVCAGGLVNDSSVEVIGVLVLPALQSAGGFANPPSLATGALRLQRLRARGVVVASAGITPVIGGTSKGQARAGSAIILQFQGFPNRHIVWSIPPGTGTITPLSTMTDAAGVALARFTPAPHVSGSVAVQVSYAS